MPCSIFGTALDSHPALLAAREHWEALLQHPATAKLLDSPASQTVINYLDTHTSPYERYVLLASDSNPS